MPELPSGIVTFLLTDVEGSATLWEQQANAMRLAQERYDALLILALAHHNGLLRTQTTTASRLAVFARATDAVAAATALQTALAAEPWPTSTPLRVRMALHTGEADTLDGDYSGLAFTRALHLRDVAHGGQIVLSRATYDLVRDAYAQHAISPTFLDLGEHRLRDLTRPEHIFQVSMPGLPSSFPPLRTLERHRHNLPVQRSPLIGRDQELTTLASLLRRSDVGLVTLTGPGGTGKTRLSLQVAVELLDDFADGVFLVELAPISEPALVASAIAATLGVKEGSSQSLLDSLSLYLRDKQLLLVLDNFEQVVSAAPLLSELLKEVRGLKLLVTSREVLHVSGEHEFAVPPLSVPNPRHLPPLERLTQYASVALFIQRAQAVKPDFEVTSANAPAVAEICARLDGLPLAIELAAARSKLLSPQALLQRLDNRLRLLVGGARDLHARQQTLRGAIDWSYNLLDPAEQTLFVRLSFFAGGWTIEAAERVCNGRSVLAIDMLDSLQSLVDKSLVREVLWADTSEMQTDTEPRFTMLETIREYALEQLLTAPTFAPAVRELRFAHTEYYVEFAEEAERLLRSASQQRLLMQLDAEHDNLRLALAWCQETEAIELGTRAVAALWYFWFLRGYFEEWGRWFRWAEQGGSGDAWARVLLGRGIRTFYEDPSERLPALQLARESLLGFQASGNRWGIAAALVLCGAAEVRTEDPQTVALGRQRIVDGRVLARELNDTWLMAWAVLLQIDVLGESPKLTHDPAPLEEGLRYARAAGDPWLIALVLFSLGHVANARGDAEGSTAYYEESLSVWRATGDRLGIGYALAYLGNNHFDRGDYAAAETRQLERLGVEQELGSKMGVAWTLLSLGEIGWACGDNVQARSYYEACYAAIRELDYKIPEAWVLINIGTLELAEAHLERATECLTEALRLSRASIDNWATAEALIRLGRVANARGDSTGAWTCFVESIHTYQQLRDAHGIVACLEGLAVALATAAIRTGERTIYLRAARFGGVAATIRATYSSVDPPPFRNEYNRVLAQAQAMQDQATWAAAWEEGRHMEQDQAIADALATPLMSHDHAPAIQPAILETAPPVSTTPDYVSGLTTRELEILRLVAAGMTNKQVAEALIISPATVNAHLTSVFSKLGVTSRTAAARFASDHHLV